VTNTGGGLAPNTVLFADIANSTGLYERFGDELAHAHIQGALSQVRTIVLQARGIVIKAIGDELMCAFASAPDAVHVACEIQARFRKPVGELPRLSFRIGLHSGDAIWKENDLFGDAVNVAARLVAMAKAEQILASQDTLALCPPSPGRSARDIGPVGVKGRRQAIPCVEVIWKDWKELTTTIGKADEELAVARLTLNFGAVTLVMDESRPQVTVGRSPDSDIVMSSPLVSGSHAVIELRRDKFFLRDQSTNGCLLMVSDNTPVRVHREEVALFDAGSIVLGGPPIEAGRTIRFQLAR
jgi:adenylate cyclase